MTNFTDKQGQYLAFIHTYSLLHDRPPAEADMQRYFRVTPPSVHRMIVELEFPELSVLAERELIDPSRPILATIEIGDDDA